MIFKKGRLRRNKKKREEERRKENKKIKKLFLFLFLSLTPFNMSIQTFIFYLHRFGCCNSKRIK